MEKKINIAELLKDCPQGMELDCTIFNGKVYFEGIDDNNSAYPIKISVNLVNIEHLDIYGQYNTRDYAKCVIFPKGKTTWEGFHRPFKDGDIIFTHSNCLKVGVGNSWISIFKEKRNGGVATYVDYAEDGSDYYSDLDEDKALLCMESDILRQRFATEEEKQKLFQAIKEHGYKWNAETKTLEKLIEPRFKAGSVVIRKKGVRERIHILNVDLEEQGYLTSIKGCIIRFEDQDNYELVPNKFDLHTLVPFESKVLVRNTVSGIWCPDFFGCLFETMECPYMTMGGFYWRYCIPYKHNEHLLGTTDDCTDYYKTWK